MSFLVKAVDTPTADPLSIPGYAKPTGSVNSRNYTSNGQRMFARSTTGTAILYNTTALTAPILRVGFKLPTASADVTDLKGACLITGPAGYGYAVLHSGGSTTGNIELRKITSGVIDATALATAPATSAAADDTVYMDRDSDGNMTVYQVPDGTAPVLKITHTDASIAGAVYGGFAVNTGKVVEFFGTEIGGEIVSITDPIIMGGEITIETTGFSNITGISGGGLEATDIVFDDGVTTANWPAITDGMTLDIALPASNVEITVTDGSGPTSTTVDIDHGGATTEFGVVIDGPTYIGGHVEIDPDDRAYYAANQPGVGDVTIYPDSRVDVDNAGTFAMFLHRLSDDDKIYRYFVTVNEHGDVVNVTRTIIMRPIDADGIVIRPLTMRGM